MKDNENRSESTGFQYRYSAKEQAELKRIREKYIADKPAPALSPMEQLRRLDAGVTRKGTVVALVLGIIGTLFMGTGMSLVMTDLKELLGPHRDKALLIGILIGLVGMIGVIVAYPLYQRITARERKKIAPEVLRLADELMGKTE